MISKYRFENRSYLLFLIFLFTFMMHPFSLCAEDMRDYIDLDFSKIENPWGITDVKTVEIREEVLKSNYYHINISEKKELIFWYYDKEFYYNSSTEKYECATQEIRLAIYLYDNKTKQFKYDHYYMYKGSTFDEKDSNIIYSNYDIETKTSFPNLTYQYKKVKQVFDKNPIYKENVDYLIQKLKASGYEFIITSNLEGKIAPILSKNKQSFSLNVIDTSYTTPVHQFNNSDIALNNDNFLIEDLSKEFVDSYVSNIDEKFDELSFSTLGGPFWSYPEPGYDKNIVLYSSFDDYFTYQNQVDPIFINDVSYVVKVPTFYKLNHFKTEDEDDYQEYILYPSEIKTFRVYFNIPQNINEMSNIFDYIARTEENSTFMSPVFYLHDTKTDTYSFNSSFTVKYASSFIEKFPNDYSIPNGIDKGYLEIDVSSAKDPILFYVKSNYIYNIEIIPVEKTNMPGSNIEDAPWDENYDDQDTTKSKNLLQNLAKNVFNYFPIIHQIKEIVNKWSWNGTGGECIYTNYNNGLNISMFKCYLIPNLKFTLWGHDYNLSAFDVTPFLKFRGTVHFWIKLSLGMITVLKCFKIIQGMLHGK